MDNDWFMFSFKVVRCPRRHVHDWSRCPYAHKSEVAARRDPRQFLYWPEPCPDSSKDPAKCPRGKACPYSHSVFEYWLHPARYKTQMCSIGATCRRTVCFFAHRPHELRTPDFPAMPPHAAAIDAGAAVLAAAQPAGASTAAPGQELRQSPVELQYAAWQQAQLQHQRQQQQHLPPDAVFGIADGMTGMLPHTLPAPQQQGDMAAGPVEWAWPQAPGAVRPAPLGLQVALSAPSVGGMALQSGYPAGSAGVVLGRDQPTLAAISVTVGLTAGHSDGAGTQAYMPWGPSAAGASASSREVGIAAGLMVPGAVLVAAASEPPGGLLPVAPASSGTPSGTFLQPGVAAALGNEAGRFHQHQAQQQPQLVTIQQPAGNQQVLLHQQLPQLVYSAAQQQLAGMPVIAGGTMQQYHYPQQQQQQQQQQDQQVVTFLHPPSQPAYGSGSVLPPGAVPSGAVAGASSMAAGMLHAPPQADQALLSWQLSHLGLQAANPNLGGQ